MPSVELSIGSVEYRDLGPAGDPKVALFVHGFLVDSTLWDAVAEQLAAAGVRCVLPEWPLGSHRLPAAENADLSPRSLAAAVVELSERLDLREVVLVGNDTGGALCQLALASHDARFAGLVLTNCDAFENFPPAWFVPLFKLARYRSSVWLLLQGTRLTAVRHSPLGYGRLLNRPRSAALTRGWIAPAVSSGQIRRDITRFARGVRRDELLAAAEWLREFNRPARIVWGTRDRCFTVATARRLEAALPNCWLEEIADATTFIPIDRPDAVSAAVTAVLQDRHRSDT